MSSSGWQIFGVAASIASTLALVPLIGGWVKSTFPSVRMRALEGLFDDTERLLNAALKEGTIDQITYQVNIEKRYISAKSRLYDLRMDVYNIRSYWEELKHWLTGLSKTISCASEEFASIRADVATRSSAGRRKITQAKAATSSFPIEPPSPFGSASPIDVACVSCPAYAVLHKLDHVTISDGKHATQDFLVPPTRPHPASIAEKRRATRRVLLGFGKKLMSTSGGSGALQAGSVARRRNDYQSRLRALSRIFYPAPAVLPHHIDASTLDSDQTSRSQKTLMSSSAFGWEDSGHVIAEVQLAA